MDTCDNDTGTASTVPDFRNTCEVHRPDAGRVDAAAS
jgi:hypothetical protein